MSRRGAVGVFVLIAWAVGFGLLARQHYVRPDAEQLAQGAINVQPGTVYFAVLQGGEQIGFAGANVDTTALGVRIGYHAVADVPLGGRLQHADVSSLVTLTRRFVLTGLQITVRWPGGTFRLDGRPGADSTMTLLTRTGRDAPDTLALHTTQPLLFPTVVPLAIALTRPPHVGEIREVRVFDPTAMGERQLRMLIARDSTFVVDDSATFDSTSKRWVGSLPHQTHAWKLVAADSGGSGTVAWVDASGQLVRFEYPGGFTLERRPYEVAYQNWTADAAARPRTVTADRDILESTAIAANSALRTRAYAQMRVRLSGVDLSRFPALSGDRQTFDAGVLTVNRESGAEQQPSYALPLADSARLTFARELAAEPLVESTRPEIAELSARIVGEQRDPRLASALIARWVHDSLTKDITFGLPDAVQVLRARRGDCNEHTALFLALARAAGIPARSAAGLAFVSGKFYYHAWPEVWTGRWVAIDPTFGETPADASHLRFVTGGLDQQAALLRLIGALKIDVLATR